MSVSLTELGLTKYEEDVYRALLRGARTAKQIAQQSNVPPTAVYPAVQSLVKKELAQHVEGVVKTYEATDPKIGIAQLVRRRIQNLQALEKKTIADLQLSSELAEEKSPITLSRGTASSIAQSTSMMEETQKTFYVLGWNFNRMKSVRVAAKQLTALKQRGVDVKLLFTHATEPGNFFREQLDKIGIPYRFVRTGYISFVIADGKQCKITLKRKALTERVNMVIEDPDLTKAIQQYYLTLWKKGKPNITS